VLGERGQRGVRAPVTTEPARERSQVEDDPTQRREALVRALGAWLALAEAADSRIVGEHWAAVDVA
jgi:hypothetical protein